MTDAERKKFTQLATDAEYAAFRIIRSFANKARRDGAPDFPIARDNLGKRVGITGRGAGELRKKFASLGVIVQAAPFVTNRFAARFRWLLGEDSAAT